MDILGIVHLLDGGLGGLVIAEVNEAEASAPAVSHDNGLRRWSAPITLDPLMVQQN